METTIATKPKKSIKLSKEEISKVRKVYDKHDTQVSAAIELGIGKETMVRLLQFGSCSETTYNKLFKN